MESIKQELRLWKASLKRDQDNGNDQYFTRYDSGVIQGLKLALAHIKREKESAIAPVG